MALADYSELSKAYKSLDDPKVQKTPEIFGGAAAYKAFNIFEKLCQEHGRPDNVSMAKEWLNNEASSQIYDMADRMGWAGVDHNQALKVAEQHIEKDVIEPSE